MRDEDDTLRAAAESRLDRLDDADEPDVDEAAGGLDVDEFGMHLEVGDTEEDAAGAVVVDAPRDDALGAIAEMFNARDLEGLVDLLSEDAEVPGILGYDPADVGPALEDLWQRRPTCCMTLGHHDDQVLGVVWEHDGEDWWRLAAVHVDDVEEGRVGLVEITDDTDLLDTVDADPPDPDELDEGMRWTEWDEGSDGPFTAR